jgi:hypothetical protein
VIDIGKVTLISDSGEDALLELTSHGDAGNLTDAMHPKYQRAERKRMNFSGESFERWLRPRLRFLAHLEDR